MSVLWRRARYWRDKADAALVEAEQRDEARDRRTPLRMALDEAEHDHHRLRSMLWLAELTFRMAEAESQRGQTKEEVP